MSKVTLTVACPEADRDDATHLAVALGWIEGWMPEEWQGAFKAQYQDASGNLYRVMSCPVGVSFVSTAASMDEIDRPPADIGEYDEGTGEYGPPYVVNLTGARRAQAKQVVWQPSTPSTPVPQAAPDKIVAVVGMTGRQAMAAMGLQDIA